MHGNSKSEIMRKASDALQLANYWANQENNAMAKLWLDEYTRLINRYYGIKKG